MPASATTGLAMPPPGHHHHRRPLPAERPHLTHCTKLLCSAFLAALLLAGVLLFVAYLAVRPHRPRFHVTAFSVSGIGAAVLLSGQLSIRNPNRDIAFFYGDPLRISVRYRDAEVVVKDLTVGPMYQPPKTTVSIAFEGEMGMDHDAAAWGGTVMAMTVKVRSRIRAKMPFWGFHWHPLHVACDVAVGHDGKLLPEMQQKRCSIDFF